MVSTLRIPETVAFIKSALHFASSICGWNRLLRNEHDFSTGLNGNRYVSHFLQNIIQSFCLQPFPREKNLFIKINFAFAD
jgi:hypothetical protein